MDPRQHSDGPGQQPANAAPGVPERGSVPGRTVPPPARTGRRRGRLKAVLAVIGGMLALLCVGGIGLGVVLYREATEPDRSAPDVVVDNYLRALLVERDDAAAGLYECAEASRLTEIRSLRTELESQERRLDTTITVSWGQLLIETQAQDKADVTTAIRRTATVDGAQQSLVDQWRFTVADDNGWRVCGAEEA